MKNTIGINSIRKKKRRKFQTIIKDKTPLLRKDIRKRENDINLELKQKITKSENQIQQLKQEKEKWWKNIWTINCFFWSS
ncbi:hypothetical protein [Spiroplasma endosymbiont of Nebria brevicollis]|uniref:hypothetical protein n=1 Tax=Spiroplasma endosymbiont of Nebria brevicollis TaxID=3066284 RepID=UPI00313ABFEC